MLLHSIIILLPAENIFTRFRFYDTLASIFSQINDVRPPKVNLYLVS